MSTCKAYVDQLVETTAKYGKYAAEALKEFNAAQERLGLSAVIDLEKLVQPEFRRLAKHKLADLEVIVEAYKNIYEKYIISMNKELLAATALLPEAERASETESLAKKIQEQIDEQSRFYSTRARWIEAAYNLSTLVEINADSIFVESGELVCSDENALEDISFVLNVIDTCAQVDSEIIRTRVARITSGLGFFGAKFA
ncbi:hypothetical protein PH586_07030 [Pseudomonas sp. SA3-5]|uniref:Uncharacterized protein n=1 Tax=Pseudomonas aestuarii TaxID=3018340 RepID=A0ABT4XD52_9PSED|nr:hypothetical protein [Pseudomonas aestuarii]MDA7086134.1 hypothetical protein [Pseudomonas aestuarii]